MEKNWATSVNFKKSSQSKQSPNRRKLVQSGHPAFLDLKYCTGLPDGLFSNKNPNWGKFWRVLQWKMLVYFTVFCYILWTLDIGREFGVYRGNLVHFPVLVFCTKKNLATLIPI
jgi:hypothetical protein